MFDDNGSFLLAVFEFFLFFAWFMCLFWIFGDIFRSRDLGGGGKTFWVIFVIFLPWLGILVYLIARGSGMRSASGAAGDAQRRRRPTSSPWPRSRVVRRPTRSRRPSRCWTPGDHPGRVRCPEVEGARLSGSRSDRLPRVRLGRGRATGMPSSRRSSPNSDPSRRDYRTDLGDLALRITASNADPSAA